MNKYDVMFTGHRPPRLGGWKENPTGLAVRAWLASIVKLQIAEGYQTFLSGGALGTDQWGAEAALDAGGIVSLALPIEAYDSKWPDFSKAKFADLKNRCKEVIVVCEGGYSPEKNLIRDDWMVARSLSVIAVWDGNPSGGTYHTIQSAKKAGLPILCFNPNTHKETTL